MSCFSVNLDIGSIFLPLWDPIGKRIGYIVKLKENLESLDKDLGKLKSVRNDLQGRVQTAERMLLKRTNRVELWLKSVKGVEREVADMKEAFQQMIIRCFGRNFRPNFCSGYKLGKRVMKKLTDVADLINEAKENSFDVVAEQPPPAAVEEMRGASALGMDPLLQKILRWLREDNDVGVIGIYGMGGVGKTSLLKKINNEFLRTLGDFHAVIWVVVSKEASIEKIQNEIGKKLGLRFAENASDGNRARDIRKALSEKRFILLLDDIWERVDLEVKVGIPEIPGPHSQNKSKVVFTTRREDVCERMKANRKVKVETLGPQDAWDLFRENAGEEALSSHPEILALAHSVAEECCGLPLALITVGRAMVCKNTPQEWEHAIAVLKTNKKPSQIEGMEDDVFIPLKFSYDALDDTLKLCFLYCSLFPEDHNIDKEQLIDYWIGEGILDEWDDLKEARNEGHFLIGRLKVACLLESGSNEENEVKMHDVLRDLALWMASNKFLVQAGVGLSKESELKRWMEAERVSLMQNNIKEITVTLICPNLVTLILRWNRSLRNVSDSFFQHMHLLRVLDLSGIGIRELPLAICRLVQLRYLNLSHTELRMLPEEMRNLVNLTYLDLNWIGMHNATLCIPHGVISRLSMLKVLKLCCGNTAGCGNIADGGFDIMELKELQYLNHLEIEISGDSDFQIFLQSLKLSKITYSLRIQCLTAQTTSARLSSIFGKVMQNLRDLWIINCKELEELMIGADRKTQDNCSILIMKSLWLVGLTNLSIIRLGCSSLQNLRALTIRNCHRLKNLNWVLQLHNIRWITVGWCNSLEEVIGNGDVEVGAEALRWLTELKLFGLPALTSISNQARSFPSLKCLHVFACEELKKLNIHCDTDPRLKISGEKEWWDGLEWEEESRSHFLPFFEERRW